MKKFKFYTVVYDFYCIYNYKEEGRTIWKHYIEFLKSSTGSV